MISNYRIVILVTSLLVILSLSISTINYMVSLESTESQLQNRSLPLSVDNIYTEIQKHIIEPNLVASMMAHDTFLKNWLVNEEEDVQQITNYLESIKNRYGMFTTFLVSQQTSNYYTSKGFIEKVEEDNPNNAWYFRFKEIQSPHEINLDFNEHIDNDMIMFINHKIFDENYHTIGATGIGLKISYINEMLERFRTRYSFRVFFIDDKGKVILYERANESVDAISNSPELVALKDEIVSKNDKVLKYTKGDEAYLINSKYIPELDLYLVVEAKVSSFTNGVKKTFYFNLFASLFVTLIVAFIILKMIRRYNKKLEYLATHDNLTQLPNRRVFNEEFEKIYLLSERHDSKLSLLFFDIDDFKNVNDTLGHQVGDRVLKRLGEILKQTLRRTDLLARWGGEEFIVALVDSSIDDAKLIAEKLRANIENDLLLQQWVPEKITASFGLTAVQKGDSVEVLMQRVDQALYSAKDRGKNRVVVI